MHRAHKRPTESADRSTAMRVASGETSDEDSGKRFRSLSPDGEGNNRWNLVNQQSWESGGMENMI